jgi:hypothetical protein
VVTVPDSYVDLLIDNNSPVACFVSLHVAFDPRLELGGINPPRFFSAAELLFSSSQERYVFSSLEPFKAFSLPRNVVLTQWTVATDSIKSQLAVTCVLLAACEAQHGAVVGGSTGAGTIRVAFWRSCNAVATAAVLAQSLARDSNAGWTVSVIGTLVEQAAEPAEAGLECGALLYHAPREFQFDVFGPVSKHCASLHRHREELQATANTTSPQPDLVSLSLYSFSSDGGIVQFQNIGADTMFEKVTVMITDMTDMAVRLPNGDAAGSRGTPPSTMTLAWASSTKKKLAAAPALKDTMVPAFYEDDGAETSSFAEM